MKQWIISMIQKIWLQSNVEMYVYVLYLYMYWEDENVNGTEERERRGKEGRER